MLIKRVWIFRKTELVSLISEYITPVSLIRQLGGFAGSFLDSRSTCKSRRFFLSLLGVTTSCEVVRFLAILVLVIIELLFLFLVSIALLKLSLLLSNSVEVITIIVVVTAIILFITALIVLFEVSLVTIITSFDIRFHIACHETSVVIVRFGLIDIGGSGLRGATTDFGLTLEDGHRGLNFALFSGSLLLSGRCSKHTEVTSCGLFTTSNILLIRLIKRLIVLTSLSTFKGRELHFVAKGV